MSRSRRKTPILGITTARSEKTDKKLWHSRWRANERTALASATDLEAHLPVKVRQSSNLWTMAKDGKLYWSKDALTLGSRLFTSYAENLSEKERTHLKTRWLRKMLGK